MHPKELGSFVALSARILGENILFLWMQEKGCLKTKKVLGVIIGGEAEYLKTFCSIQALNGKSLPGNAKNVINIPAKNVSIFILKRNSGLIILFIEGMAELMN